MDLNRKGKEQTYLVLFNNHQKTNKIINFKMETPFETFVFCLKDFLNGTGFNDSFS